MQNLVVICNLLSNQNSLTLRYLIDILHRPIKMKEQILKNVIIVQSDRLMATRIVAIKVYSNEFPKHGSVLWALNV
jgi:hypothetical protein